MKDDFKLEFPEFNGIKLTDEEIEEILDINSKCKCSFDLIDAD